MATFAFDSSDAQDAFRPPISLHPAFPAIVALWFAALLGIGSLVLPVVLVERVVTLTGLADPPLGFMTRGLIALGAALAGAVAGVAVARRVARAHEERPSRVAKFGASARRPISVNEELGGEGLVNGRSLPVTRRRALAIAEDERPSDFLYMAPLPGHDDEVHELAFDAETSAPAAPEPLELCDPLEDLAVADIAASFVEPASPFPDEDEPMTVKQEFQPFATSPRAGRTVEDIVTRDSRTAEPEPLPFAAPSLARRALHAGNDTHFAAPELAEPQPVEPRFAEPRIPEPYIPETHFAEPQATEPPPVAPEEPPFRGDWAAASVPDLGMVQLVQRLGASIERRRERAALASTVAPALASVPVAPGDFDAAPAEEAVQAMAAYFGKPAGSSALSDAGYGEGPQPTTPPAPLAAAPPAPAAARPSLLRQWHGEDDEDEHDPLPSFTLPLRTPVVPTIAFDQAEQPRPVEDEDDAEGNDDSYSSLLAMRNPFAQKDNGFVRIEEPEAEDGAIEPAVVFPGREQRPAFANAGASPPRPFDQPGEGAAAPAVGSQPAAETDAALRAALATLQRMSGTA